MLATLECPYCGEPFETLVDCSGGSQDYIRPIEFRLVTGDSGEAFSLAVRRDDD